MTGSVPPVFQTSAGGTCFGNPYGDQPGVYGIDFSTGSMALPDAHIANPLLHTICPCLVEGHIFFYVVVNLFACQCAECDVGAIDQFIVQDGVVQWIYPGKAYGRIDLVGLATELC